MVPGILCFVRHFFEGRCFVACAGSTFFSGSSTAPWFRFGLVAGFFWAAVTGYCTDSCSWLPLSPLQLCSPIILCFTLVEISPL